MRKSLWRYSSSVTSVHAAFRPFYRFVQPLGFLCFAEHSGQFTDRTHWPNAVALLLNTLLNLAALWFTLGLTNTMASGPQLLQSGFLYANIAAIITQLLGNGIAFVRRQRIASILLRMQRIDEQLALVGVRPNHWQHWQCVAGGCLTNALLLAALTVSSVWVSVVLCPHNYVSIAVRTLSYAFILQAYCVKMVAYILALLAVRTRVTALNGRIHAINTHTDVRTVQRLGRIYEALNEVCDRLNDTFAVIVLGSVGSVFAGIIVSIFAMYSILRHVGELGSLFVIVFCWNAYTLLWLLVLIYAGDALALAGRRTGRMVHRRLNADCGEPAESMLRPHVALMLRSLENLSGQVLHRCPTAHCGLFPIDWTLFFAVSVMR